MTEVARYGRVAVLMGGTAAERDVSLRSGAAVAKALAEASVNCSAIDLRGPADLLSLPGHCDRAFIAIHGRGGEDGTLQGALEALAIPYTGSGVLASALAMDKLRSKLIWQASGLPTPAWLRLDASTTFEEVVDAVGGPPFMVKPAHEGSSVGVALVDDFETYAPALRAALDLDDTVLAEQYIRGGEYTAPILGDRELPLVKLEPARAFYDYTAKYLSNDTVYRCPCGLDVGAERRIQALARRGFDALGCAVWGRIDFMVDGAGNPYLIEANTVPGMTEHSLMPRSAAQAGIDFTALVLQILDSTLGGPA